MREQPHSALTAFHRLRRLSAHLLPWIVAALLFTGIAHAAHLHKPDAQGQTDTLHCGFCVQLDRLGTAPSTPQPSLAPAPADWGTQSADIVHSGILLLDLYDARGPPRL